MICDRSFAADGSFAYPGLDQGMRSCPGCEADWMEGVLGDVVLVNGAPWPVHEVDAARYRLRLLNAANARRFRLVLRVPGAPDLPFTQIGSDGGLLAAPVVRPSVEIAPGERFDVVVDFSLLPVGTEVTMVNALGDGLGGRRDALPGGARGPRRQRRARPARRRSEVLVPGRHAADVPVHARPLGPAHAAGRSTAALRPDHLAGRHPAGRRSSSGGSSPTSTTRCTSTSTPFQVLRRGSGGPGPSDAGWKDTVDLRPAEVVDVAVRFTEHAGRFVLHCHNLEHEDMAMMATIRTV